MQCYFYANPGNAENGNKDMPGFVSFSIPDIGISFKAVFNGKSEECEYSSLLALLEFVDLNPQLFKNKNLEIYSNSFMVVHQVNLKLAPSKELEPFRNLALNYKKKIPYTLNWIPKGDNPAQNIFATN
jgi:hypothetical protein